MMIPLTTVTTKGQVTIPEAVRLALGVSVGDRVVFCDLMPEKKEVKVKIISSSSLDRLYGSLKTAVPYQTRRKERMLAARALGKRYT